MLSRVTVALDKREGSIIYDALAPAAAELAQAFIELDLTERRVSLEYATGDDLTRKSYEFGVFRKKATYAVRKGTFNNTVPIDSRFNANGLNYKVVALVSNFDYRLECEQSGEIGNVHTGAIIPIDYITGLTTAVLSDVLIPGSEEETDDQLRERTRLKIVEPSQDGNKAQYIDWALSYEGVGSAKVFPLWNGGNTVRVAITDRLFQPAGSALVNEFQNYLDPNSQGLGNGKAPIGVKVTVSSGTEKQINIKANVVLKAGYLSPEGISEAVNDYLSSITYVTSSVSYMRIAVTLLDCPSIADISDLTINNANTDIALMDDEIPILNNLNLTVVN